MGTISVVIPTWNRESTLLAAVRSVLNQTLDVHEVLICDDGSTDRSKESLEEIKDPRIHWIEGERGGRPAIPRNRGMALAKGDWIAFLDSDDVWMPNKLEIQLKLAEVMGCKAVSSNAFRSINGRRVADLVLSSAPERVTYRELLRINWVICSSAVIHKSLMKDVSGFPEDPALRALEDYAFWLRISSLTDIALAKEPLVEYADNPATSIRSSDSTSEWCQKSRVLTDLRLWLKSRHDLPDSKLLTIQCRIVQGEVYLKEIYRNLRHQIHRVLNRTRS